jgi:hypothetical protein
MAGPSLVSKLIPQQKLVMPTKYLATIQVRVNNDKGRYLWTPLFRPGGNFPKDPAFTVVTLSFDPLQPMPVGPDNRVLVAIDASNNVKVFGPVVLKFTFPDTTFDVPPPLGPLAAFYPIGLSYSGTMNGALAATDIDSLPRHLVRYGSDPRPGGGPYIPFVEIVDLWNPASAANGHASWDYMIMIQDNFGQVGAIDPDIENESVPDTGRS